MKNRTFQHSAAQQKQGDLLVPAAIPPGAAVFHRWQRNYLAHRAG
jgi:hypothetical protein